MPSVPRLLRQTVPEKYDNRTMQRCHRRFFPTTSRTVLDNFVTLSLGAKPTMHLPHSESGNKTTIGMIG